MTWKTLAQRNKYKTVIRGISDHDKDLNKGVMTSQIVGDHN